MKLMLLMLILVLLLWSPPCWAHDDPDYYGKWWRRCWYDNVYFGVDTTRVKGGFVLLLCPLQCKLLLSNAWNSRLSLALQLCWPLNLVCSCWAWSPTVEAAPFSSGYLTTCSMLLPWQNNDTSSQHQKNNATPRVGHEQVLQAVELLSTNNWTNKEMTSLV